MEHQQHISGLGLPREPQVLPVPPHRLLPKWDGPRHEGGAPVAQGGQLCVHLVRPAALHEGQVWPADGLPGGDGAPLQQDGPE